MKNLQCAVLFVAISLVPAWAEKARPMDVAFDAVIETIQFEDVSAARQKQVLSRIGVQTGDRLTADVKQQIGRALRSAQNSVAEKPLTFTYTPGAKSGTAKLIISAGC